LAGAAADRPAGLKDSVDRAAPVAAEQAARVDGHVSYVYEHALKGYAISMPPGLVDQLGRDSRVASIERDGEATAFHGAVWCDLGARPRQPAGASARQ
jgi:hypothetical protein